MRCAGGGEIGEVPFRGSARPTTVRGWTGSRAGQKVVYYESIKRELKRRLIHEYRSDERLQTKTEESTLLADTGLVVELEHLKIKTRLIDKKFTSVRGECEI